MFLIFLVFCFLMKQVLTASSVQKMFVGRDVNGDVVGTVSYELLSHVFSYIPNVSNKHVSFVSRTFYEIYWCEVFRYHCGEKCATQNTIEAVQTAMSMLNSEDNHFVGTYPNLEEKFFYHNYYFSVFNHEYKNRNNTILSTFSSKLRSKMYYVCKMISCSIFEIDGQQIWKFDVVIKKGGLVARRCFFSMSLKSYQMSRIEKVYQDDALKFGKKNFLERFHFNHFKEELKKTILERFPFVCEKFLDRNVMKKQKFYCFEEIPFRKIMDEFFSESLKFCEVLGFIEPKKKRGRPRISLSEEDVKRVLDPEYIPFRKQLKSRMRHKLLDYSKTLSAYFKDHVVRSEKDENGKPVEFKISVSIPKIKCEGSVITTCDSVGKPVFSSKGIQKETSRKTGKEHLVYKEKIGISMNSYRDHLTEEGLSGEFDKVGRVVRKTKDMIANSQYLLKKKDKKKGTEEQFGIIMNPIHVSEEALTTEDSIFDFFEKNVEYVNHARDRKKELNFKPLVELDMKKRDKNLHIHLKTVKLIIGDESYTLSRVKKFLLSYLRDLFTDEPLSMKVLCPWIYQKKGTNFLENSEIFGEAYEDLITEFEKHTINRNITKNAQGFVDILKYLPNLNEDMKKITNAIKEGGNVYLNVNFEAVYLEDLSEVRSKFRTKYFPIDLRKNKQRTVGFFSAPITHDECDLLEFEKTNLKLLQFDILRRNKDIDDKYNGVINHFFDDTEEIDSLSGKSGKFVFLEMLHNFRPKEMINRKFLLLHFIPALLKLTNFEKEKDYSEKFKFFIESCIEKDVIEKGTFNLNWVGDVVFKDDLAFFNQKTNLKFFKKMGDITFPVNDLITQYIEGIGNEEVKNSMKDIHQKILVVHWKRLYVFQKLVYKDDYFSLDDMFYFAKIADLIDAVHDSICCHFLKCFPHYRSIENKLLITQLVRIGKLNLTCIQNAEQAHKKQKFREYQREYRSPKEKKRDIKLFRNDTTKERFNMEMACKSSQVFVHGKIGLQGKYNFRDSSDDVFKNLSTAAPKFKKDEITTHPRANFEDDVEMEDSPRENDDTEQKDDKELEYEKLIQEHKSVELRPKPSNRHYDEIRDFRDYVNESLKSFKNVKVGVVQNEGLLRVDYLSESEITCETFPISNKLFKFFKPKQVEIVNEELQIVQDVVQCEEEERKKLAEEEEKIRKEQEENGGNMDVDSDDSEEERDGEVDMNELFKNMSEAKKVEFRDREFDRCILHGTDCGGGKTIAITFGAMVRSANGISTAKFVISNGNLILDQWKDDAMKIADNLGVEIPPFYYLNQSSDVRKTLIKCINEKAFLLCTFRSISKITEKDVLFLKEKGIEIIVDECQYLKNMSSQFMKSLVELSRVAIFRIFSSATPINGKKKQAQSLISIMLGRNNKNIIPKEINLQLLREVIAERMIRAKLDINVKCAYIKIGLRQPKQVLTCQTLYEKNNSIDRKMLVEKDKWLSAIDGHKYANFFCNSIDLFRKKDPVLWKTYKTILCGEKHFTERDFNYNPKLKISIDFASQCIQKKENVVIFSKSIEFCKYIRDCFDSKSKVNPEYLSLKNKMLLLHGEMSMKQRGDVKAIFNSGKSCFVLIVSMKLSEAGVNLQKANNAIRMTFCDDATSEIQVPGRIYRTGQTLFCRFLDLYIEGSMEELYFDQKMAGRLSLIQNVMGRNEFSKKDIISIKNCDILFGITDKLLLKVLEDNKNIISKSSSMEEVIFGNK